MQSVSAQAANEWRDTRCSSCSPAPGSPSRNPRSARRASSSERIRLSPGSRGHRQRGHGDSLVTIAADGSVSNVEVAQPVEESFVLAAKEALSHWRCAPATDGEQRSSVESTSRSDFCSREASRRTPGSSRMRELRMLPSPSGARRAARCRRKRRGLRRRTAPGARGDGSRQAQAAQPWDLRLPSRRRRPGDGAPPECLGRAQAGAGDPAHERGRPGPRRAGLPSRLRRSRGAGHRVHRRRRANQRERQPARKRVLRYALHNPRADRLLARRRGSLRSAARQLRGGRLGRLSSCARAARGHVHVLGGELRNRASSS